MKRPILLGLINPHPTEDLYVRPVGCSGYRLAAMISEFSSLTEDDYLSRFDRRNLLRTNMDDPVEAALSFRSTLGSGDQVVVLGEAARRALDLPRLLIHPLTVEGVTYRQIPHPSGLNRFYNDKTLRMLVAKTLLSLIGEEDASP